jgi:vacuolar protein sorting-associated protein 16
MRRNEYFVPPVRTFKVLIPSRHLNRMAPIAAGTNPFDDDDDDDDEEDQNKNGLPLDIPASSILQSHHLPVVQMDTTVEFTVRAIMESCDNREDEEPDTMEWNTELPAEASWQYLGELPYRRISVYSPLRWGGRRHGEGGYFTGNGDNNDLKNQKINNNPENANIFNDEEYIELGLACFPRSYQQQQRRSDLMMDDRDVFELLTTSTVTKVAGCPNGGPIATITLPVFGGAIKISKLRILTNSGMPLASILLPPKSLVRSYSAADIMMIGFTSRTILVILLRDSLCMTYDLQGQPILPPFPIIPSGIDGKSVELLQAHIFEGGVAVLSVKMHSAIVEFLDENDDPTYANSAHLGARRISPSTNTTVEGRAAGEMFGGNDAQPSHYAICTPLHTALFAREHGFTYVAIAVLARTHTASRHPDVFLSTSDHSVVIVNTLTTNMIDVECRSRIPAPIVAMSFAPNGRFLACFTQSSTLIVISTSFETKVLNFDTSEGSHAPPQDMQWCGEDSVVLHWKKLGILMVGPYGDWLRFPYEQTENLHIVPEIDCCRVVTDHCVELLQRVPPATAALLRIGSIEPSAMMLDASDAFSSGSPSSDEAARAITRSGMLLEAIEICADAATREFDVAIQKRLLRAASYGLHFSFKDPDHTCVVGGPGMTNDLNDDDILPSEVAIKFTSAARKLRVMNSLRDPRVGLTLTTSQYDLVTPVGVVARLVAINRPALATAISKYLNLPSHVQLFARSAKASALVMSHFSCSDAELADMAIQIINEHQNDPSIHSGGFAAVALAANKAGRPGVANLLLKLETSVADKVPALISTGNFEDAVAVATKARDAEFIFFTLMEFEKVCMATPANDPTTSQSNFINTVIHKFTAEALDTLRRYLETMSDIKSVMNLLLRAQRSIDVGSTMAKKAFDPINEPADKLKLLVEASRLFSLGKDTGFQKSCTDEQIDLIRDQEVLRTKYGTPEVAPTGSSLIETMASIIRYAATNKRESHRLLGDVDKLAKKFRVSDKRLWHLKVTSFSESDQWPQLRSLSDSKTKSPIGFKPFALAAIRGKQPVSEIMRYIERVSLAEERYELFAEAALWKRALDEAGKLRDPRRVANIKASCNVVEIQGLADQLLLKLSNQ